MFQIKNKIIENVLDIANVYGIQNPKLAPLADVEIVKPKMPEIVMQAELTKMNAEGIQIFNIITERYYKKSDHHIYLFEWLK